MASVMVALPWILRKKNSCDVRWEDYHGKRREDSWWKDEIISTNDTNLY